MSKARIYLNKGEVYGGRKSERVDMTTTASPAELLGRNTALGYGFGATLDALGIDQMQVLHMQEDGLIMMGNPEDVSSRIKNLRQSIGQIASEAARHDRGSQHLLIGDTIDRIAQALPDTIASTPDMLNIVAKIVDPFGEETNQDGCDVVFNANHIWYPGSDPYLDYTNPEAAKIRDRRPYRTAFLNVDRTQGTLLRYLSLRDQTSAAVLFDNALELYLRERLKDPALLSDLREKVEYTETSPPLSENDKKRLAELNAAIDYLDGYRESGGDSTAGE